MTGLAILSQFAGALASGQLKLVDLTAPLGPATPIIALPPEVGRNSPKIEIHNISDFDEHGPLASWNWLVVGEHSGTHFDTPGHWITGRDLPQNLTDTIPPERFVAPACVVDCSRQTEADPDFVLTADGLRAWERQHGDIPRGSWILMRTDWHRRNHDEKLFLNIDANGPHSPGPSEDCVLYAIEKGIIGWGAETIGTDAGQSGGWSPQFPVHYHMSANGRYGLTSLCNLDQLPPTGAMLFAAPLKIAGGTGSPLRAIAIVPCG